MAVALLNSNVFSTPGGVDPLVLPLTGYTTSLNDCLVVALGVAGTPTLNISGLGATWVQIANANAPELDIWVGYGCEPGFNTITITGQTNRATSVIWSAWRGISPFPSPVGVPQLQTGVSASTITTPAVPYTKRMLVVGAGCAGSGNVVYVGSTWGDGNVNTNIGNISGNTLRSLVLDYEIVSAVNSTTYTTTVTGGTQTLRATAVALTPAPSTFTPKTDNIVPPIYIGGPDMHYPVPRFMDRLMRHFQNENRGRNIFLMSDGSVVDSQVGGTPPNMIQPPTAPYARAIYEQGGAMVEQDFFQVPYVLRTLYGGVANVVNDAESAQLIANGYSLDP